MCGDSYDDVTTMTNRHDDVIIVTNRHGDVIIVTNRPATWLGTINAKRCLVLLITFPAVLMSKCKSENLLALHGNL